jgi:ribonucleoside-triphosphate reductase
MADYVSIGQVLEEINRKRLVNENGYVMDHDYVSESMETIVEKDLEIDKSEFKNMVKAMPCETYSRIVGYFRPISNWNVGKKEEYNDRQELILNKEEFKTKLKL